MIPSSMASTAHPHYFMSLSRMFRPIYLALLLLLSPFVFAMNVLPQNTTVTLSYSDLFPPSHQHSAFARQWGVEVERRSGGRIKIAHYSSTLMKPHQMIESVAHGVTDIGQGAFGYNRRRFLLTEVGELPLGVGSGYIATKMFNELYRTFRPKELEDVKILYLHGQGPSLLAFRRPVTRADDVKGVKVSAYGSQVRMVALLGVLPLAIPANGTYAALASGYTDGVMCPAESLITYKFEDFVNYVIRSSASSCAGFYVAMNRKKWNALPTDLQSVIEGVSEEWIDKQGRMWDALDRQAFDSMSRKGIKTITLSEKENERWMKRLQPMTDDYLSTTKYRALPGKKALDFCVNYLKAIQR